MKHSGYLAAAFGACLAAVFFLLIKTLTLRAKGLNAEKNGVKISNALDSVLQTQVAALANSIKSKSQSAFQRTYNETLSACNGCHESAGCKFIHIVRPAALPVSNQRW